MWIVLYIISLLLIILTWYFIMWFLFRWKKIFYMIEYLLYSYCLWFIVIWFLMFLMWWIGVPFTMIWILSLLIVFNVILWSISHYLAIKPDFQWMWLIDNFRSLNVTYKLLICVWVVWISWKFVIWFVDIVSIPTYRDDAFWNWNFRWKVWYYKENLDFNKNSDTFLGWWYSQYPLSPSILKTYFLKFYWDMNEWIMNLESFYFYVISILLIFFTLFRHTKDIKFAFLWSYLLSSVPLYYIHGISAYFDLFMWLYFFIAIYMSYLYMEKYISIYPVIMFIGILGYTKSEWLIVFMVSILLSFLLIRLFEKNSNKRNRLDIGEFFRLILWVIIINMPFIVFKLIYWLGFWNWSESITKSIIEMKFHPEIIAPYYYAIFYEWNYNLLYFFLLILILVSLIKKKIRFDSEFIFLLSLILWFWIIFFIYFSTFTFQFVMDQTWVNRSMIQIIMLSVFVMVLYIYRLTDGWKN